MFARYLEDGHYGDDVLQAAEKGVLIPQCVLSAHWDTDDAYEMLYALATRFRIVPDPLQPFIEDCIRRTRPWDAFLHGESLFKEPCLAEMVYRRMGDYSIPVSRLQVLHELASSPDSGQYGHFVEDALVRAFADLIFGMSNDWSVLMVCRLCSHYLSDTGIASLCPRALAHLMQSSEGAVSAIRLMRRMWSVQRVKVVGAIAWRARMGCGVAQQYMQDMSVSHPHEVSRAIMHYMWQPYIDRLSLDVLWLVVDYLRLHRAWYGLRRLFVCDAARAIRHGVFTSLVEMGKCGPLMNRVPCERPSTAHASIHFMCMRRRPPPNWWMVDVCMCDELGALSMLARRSQPIRRQMQLGRNWSRRRVAYLALQHCESGIWPALRAHEFAWRIVFGYL